ncbi:MAG: Eco57I restriction-modification methylase domain-containing protein [Myxococcales bacterium]|nr:Eco57I restriction-modification methylase domain-containing protein [Myxococcales bacterium]
MQAGAGAHAPRGADEASRRKHDGVYYTPAWVTDLLVRHTLGVTIDELRRDAGLSAAAPEPGPLAAFERALRQLKLVDPACGVGALLLPAVDALVAARRWIAEQRRRLGVPDDPADPVRDVLAHNIHGVDIDPRSVRLTRAALLQRTADPDVPLPTLERTIRRGNSLVDPAGADPALAPFDWTAAFPAAFDRPDPGFDCVLGNPPYVKLQNLRKAQPALAAHLQGAYASARTGNFDLYLPFVERGLALLRRSGLMGYIAPSGWLLGEYGAGLRALVHARRALARWIDFGDHQVFADATTYTALQVFRPHAPAVACVFASDGDVGELDWSRPDATIPYAELSPASPWVFAPDRERRLLARLRADCTPLARSADAIIVGIQTSADVVYHLERLAPGTYRSFAGDSRGHTVELEDELLRPLVSGAHAKRYRDPSSTTHLLFPYDDSGPRARLLAPDELRRFPRAWDYLLGHAPRLRARERRAFDDEQWYRFGRNQNIDKQKLPKLVVPRLTVDLAAACDPTGAVALDNVDVGGILAADGDTLWFLLAVLNGPVATYEWRRRTRPFANGFRAANKQFIAPLAVPAASAADRAAIAARARALQALHTARAPAAALEAEMNDHLAALYDLTAEERELIAADRR